MPRPVARRAVRHFDSRPYGNSIKSPTLDTLANVTQTLPCQENAVLCPLTSSVVPKTLFLIKWLGDNDNVARYFRFLEKVSTSDIVSKVGVGFDDEYKKQLVRNAEGNALTPGGIGFQTDRALQAITNNNNAPLQYPYFDQGKLIVAFDRLPELRKNGKTHSPQKIKFHAKSTMQVLSISKDVETGILDQIAIKEECLLWFILKHFGQEGSGFYSMSLHDLCVRLLIEARSMPKQATYLYDVAQRMLEAENINFSQRINFKSTNQRTGAMDAADEALCGVRLNFFTSSLVRPSEIKEDNFVRLQTTRFELLTKTFTDESVQLAKVNNAVVIVSFNKEFFGLIRLLEDDLKKLAKASNIKCPQYDDCDTACGKDKRVREKLTASDYGHLFLRDHSNQWWDLCEKRFTIHVKHILEDSQKLKEELMKERQHKPNFLEIIKRAINCGYPDAYVQMLSEDDKISMEELQTLIMKQDKKVNKRDNDPCFGSEYIPDLRVQAGDVSVVDSEGLYYNLSVSSKSESEDDKLFGGFYDSDSSSSSDGDDDNQEDGSEDEDDDQNQNQNSFYAGRGNEVSRL